MQLLLVQQEHLGQKGFLTIFPGNENMSGEKINPMKY